MKPGVSFETRRRALALSDAELLVSLSRSDRAAWLEHFFGYPMHDATNKLEHCEREAFIENDASGEEMNFCVTTSKGERHEFRSESEAYQWFCEHYAEVVIPHIEKTELEAVTEELRKIDLSTNEGNEQGCEIVRQHMATREKLNKVLAEIPLGWMWSTNDGKQPTIEDIAFYYLWDGAQEALGGGSIYSHGG